MAQLIRSIATEVKNRWTGATSSENDQKVKEEKIQQVIQKIERAKVLPRIEVSIGKSHYGKVGLSQNLNLADFSVLRDHPLQNHLIEALNLQKSIAIIDRHFPFYERLYTVSLEVLEQVSLFSFQMLDGDFLGGHIHLALMKDEEVIDISVKSLQWLPLKLYHLKLKSAYSQPDRIIQLARMRVPKDRYQMPGAKMWLLNAKQIQKMAPKLPDEAFGILDDKQVADLDFSKLSESKVLHVLKGCDERRESVRKRLSILSFPQWRVIVESYLLFQFVAKDGWDLIPFSLLNEHQINELYCSCVIPKPEQKRRVALISVDDLNRHLSMIDEPLCHLNDEQIAGLDYSKATETQIWEVLNGYSLKPEEKKRRISLLSSASLDIICQKGCHEILEFVEDEFIRDGDLRKWPNVEKTLFPTFEPSLFHPGYQYKYVEFLDVKSHEYTKKDKTGSSSNSMSDDVMQKEIVRRKAICTRSLRLISDEQYHFIQGKLTPEVLELARTVRNKG